MPDTYLIDTDCVVRYLAGTVGAIDPLHREGSALYLSVISYTELLWTFYGMVPLPDRTTALQNLTNFMRSIRVLEFTIPVFNTAEEILQRISNVGQIFVGRTLDLLVASTAVHYDLLFVTGKAHLFQQIPGLRIQSL